MLKSISFAHAATIVASVLYVLCALFSSIAPQVLLFVARSWVHTVNLELIVDTRGLSIPTLFLGLVTWSAFVWVTTYTTALLYNTLAKQG